MTAETPAAGSFRDPHGFVFHHEGTVHRQVNRVHQARYDGLMQSGLYDALTAPRPEIAYRVLQPEPVPFISYPYEWCRSQTKDAAEPIPDSQRIVYLMIAR